MEVRNELVAGDDEECHEDEVEEETPAGAEAVVTEEEAAEGRGLGGDFGHGNAPGDAVFGNDDYERNGERFRRLCEA